WGPALLEVLDLLADALELLFGRDHVFLDLRVIGLAPDGIRLAHHFLKNEPKALPDRVSRFGLRGLAERSQVRPESIELLGNVEFVGEDGDLLGDSLRVAPRASHQLGHRTLNPFMLLLQTHRS